MLSTPEGMERFPVSKGMLTPMGMRQRYLLGKYNRYKMDMLYGYERKINEHKMNTRSTAIPRTVQSGYAELLGFGNDGKIDEDLKLSGDQLENLAKQDTSTRHPYIRFRIRNFKDINKELEENATAEGFCHLPIHTQKDGSHFEDPLGYGCKYLSEQFASRPDDAKVFKDVMYLVDDTRQIYKTEFALTPTQTEDMSFNEAYHYSDYIMAEVYEGMSTRKLIKSEDMDKINSMQKWAL